MTYTPEQLREWADDVERMGHLPTAQIYRAHAAALEENAKLAARVAELEKALRPAWEALDRIDAAPNDMEVRRQAEVAAFYSIQRARSKP